MYLSPLFLLWFADAVCDTVYCPTVYVYIHESDFSNEIKQSWLQKNTYYPRGYPWSDETDIKTVNVSFAAKRLKRPIFAHKAIPWRYISHIIIEY